MEGLSPLNLLALWQRQSHLNFYKICVWTIIFFCGTAIIRFPQVIRPDLPPSSFFLIYFKNAPLVFKSQSQWSTKRNSKHIFVLYKHGHTDYFSMDPLALAGIEATGRNVVLHQSIKQKDNALYRGQWTRSTWNLRADHWLVNVFRVWSSDLEKTFPNVQFFFENMCCQSLPYL